MTCERESFGNAGPHVAESEFDVDGPNGRIFCETVCPECIREGAPLVVISHGLGLTHRSVMEYAIPLAESGYPCVVFDFCNANPHSRSGCDTTKVSIQTEIADLCSVLGASLLLPCAANRKVVLMGQSLGGAASAVVAARRQDVVEGLILLFPAFSIADEARRRFGSEEAIPDTFMKWGTFLAGKVLARDAMKMDFDASIREFRGDVLILHGDADTRVPIEYSRRAVSLYRNAQLVVVPGSDHRFVGDDYPFALGCVELFLKNHW